MTERKTVTIGVELPGNSGGPLNITWLLLLCCSRAFSSLILRSWFLKSVASHCKKKKGKRELTISLVTEDCNGDLLLYLLWPAKALELTSNDDNCRKRCVILWETSVCCAMFARPGSRLRRLGVGSLEPMERDERLGTGLIDWLDAHARKPSH